MEIQDLQEKYDLKKDDFWHHQQSGQWILTHDAVEKIANQEGIKVVDIAVLNSDVDLVRFLVSMSNPSGGIVKSIGEADRKNCHSQYLGCMAEKRGIDRCVLKHIDAYQYGISSEVEADDFAKPKNYKYIKTDNELEKFVKYKKDDYFKTHMQDINMSVSELNDNWDMCNSKTKTHEFIKQMETRIKERKNGESEHENR